ncbi:hypothetical protein UFOVP639_12 [uncultured Caudovirales phage]|uniref:Uncharacterized protein n=1 Tax=uncultured Caudovirales phage TaxID=2100421 RepID=A0A6J5NDM4_9CAUD|nr:hypothetical protein UFOVP639_12 [uncultured Caudovirales phage]
MSDSINKTINIDVNVESQNLDKAAKGVEKITKETENHTKSLEHNRKGVLENGGAMGLLGAATGGLAMDFKDAVEAVEGMGISLKGLRGAIIATGIGALAIIVLELVTNWEKWKGVITGSTEEMAKLTQEYEDLIFWKDREMLANERNAAISAAKGESEEKQYKIAIQNAVDLVKSLEAQIQKQAKLAAEEYDRNGRTEEYIALQKEVVSLENEKYKAETTAVATFYKEETRQRELSIEAQKKASEEKLANDKKYLTESIAFIKKYYDIIDTTGKALIDFSNTGFGKAYTDLTNLHKLVKDFAESTKLVQEKIAETQRKLSSNTLTDKEYNQLKKQYAELVAQEADSREKSGIGLKLALAKQREVLIAARDEKDANAKIIEQYDELNRLKFEEYELNNKLFEYEKSADGRLDNSNKFSEIQDRINETYERRIEIIEKSKLAEREVLQEKQDSLKYDLDLLESDRLLLDQKVKGRKDFNEEENARLKELEDRRKLSGQTEYGMLIDLEAKRTDLEVQMSTNSVAIAKNTADLMLEIATTTSDKELEIEANTWEKRKLMRDEALDREQQYKAASMGIATETQNFLDALIANGHQKGKKDAENALALRKVIGVANVVITGQEEIRGIWANPSLTALPDTGVVSKGLLTAAAVARAGLSIATILAQKLTGGSSGNNSSSGTANAPQASFNIVGSSTTNQLAATIAAQQQQPVKAYVVGTDMTTQQALDRNITNNATFL